MKKITTLLLLLINSHLFSQSFPEKELTTAINEVTVFQNSAQIFESGKVSIPKGTSVLRIKGLTPYLDEKSIQVKHPLVASIQIGGRALRVNAHKFHPLQFTAAGGQGVHE